MDQRRQEEENQIRRVQSRETGRRSIASAPLSQTPSFWSPGTLPMPIQLNLSHANPENPPLTMGQQIHGDQGREVDLPQG